MSRNLEALVTFYCLPADTDAIERGPFWRHLFQPIRQQPLWVPPPSRLISPLDCLPDVVNPNPGVGVTPGGLVSTSPNVIIVQTTPNSYTPTAGVALVRVQILSPGGGGGGSAACAAGQAAAASGAQGGNYLEVIGTLAQLYAFFVQPPGTPFPITIGAPGIGGPAVAAGAAGTPGGNMIFGTLPVPGGGQGAAGLAMAAFPFVGGGALRNGNDGTGTNPFSVAISSPTDPTRAVLYSATVGHSGAGGGPGGPWGRPAGSGGNTFQADGNSSTALGAGGGGGLSLNGGVAQQGGTPSTGGLVQITEYFP